MKHAAVNIAVTPQQLMELSECSQRMTSYADPNGSLLITVISSQQGVPVRLILDRQCVHRFRTELKTGTLDSS